MKKALFYSESLWLHVHASGHWTRRVYELFRKKLIEKHGGMLNDFNDLRLRSSMRSRMSKSYIDELRGTHQQCLSSPIDLNNNNNNNANNSNRSSNCSMPENNWIQPKMPGTKLLATTKNQNKTKCSSCQTTLSLCDIKVDPIEKNHSTVTESSHPNVHKFGKSIIMNPNELKSITVEDVDKLSDGKHNFTQTEQQTKSIKIIKPVIKTNNSTNYSNSRLAAPTSNDYCTRILNNRSTICPEQPSMELKEIHSSDALGYLRMYKSHNRIQFNSLKLNDREDLQVNKIIQYILPSIKHKKRILL